MFRRTVLIALLAAGGCTPTATNESSSGLTEREFIDLYVALRDAQNMATSAQEFEQLKQKIFDEAGAKPEHLLEFAREQRADIGRMAALWDSIRIRTEQAPEVPR